MMRSLSVSSNYRNWGLLSFMMIAGLSTFQSRTLLKSIKEKSSKFSDLKSNLVSYAILSPDLRVCSAPICLRSIEDDLKSTRSLKKNEIKELLFERYDYGHSNFINRFILMTNSLKDISTKRLENLC